jgi:ABC-type uncharacterized transport system YnjBCD permease subunit
MELGSGDIKGVKVAASAPVPAHIMYAYEYMISCIAGKWKRLSHVCYLHAQYLGWSVVWFASPLALRLERI